MKTHVESASAKLIWEAPAMLPQIPVASKDLAAFLVELTPFEPRLDQVLVESPSTRMADVALKIGLRDDVQLSLFYTGFQIDCPNLGQRHLVEAGSLADLTWQTLAPQRSLGISGKVVVAYLSHWRIDSGSVRGFLAERLPSPDRRLIPSGFSFQIDDEDLSGRLIIEESARLADGLFVDCRLVYRSGVDFVSVVQHARNTVDRLTNVIGLNRDAEPS